MSTDFEKGLRKTIDLSVRSREFTVDTLKSAMQDFLSGKSQRKGRVSMKKLSEHSGKLELLRVYLKHEEDAKIVKEDMDKLCPDVPIVYLYADVCREELLVEIEGIAYL